MTRFVAGPDGKPLRPRAVPVIRADVVRAELKRAERDGVTVVKVRSLWAIEIDRQAYEAMAVRERALVDAVDRAYFELIFGRAT